MQNNQYSETVMYGQYQKQPIRRIIKTCLRICSNWHSGVRYRVPERKFSGLFYHGYNEIFNEIMNTHYVMCIDDQIERRERFNTQRRRYTSKKKNC